MVFLGVLLFFGCFGASLSVFCCLCVLLCLFLSLFGVSAGLLVFLVLVFVWFSFGRVQSAGFGFLLVVVFVCGARCLLGFPDFLLFPSF